MRKKHEENKDVRCLVRNSNIRVDERTKVIKANRGSGVGIRAWGRIDFLCHYRGWHFLWDNSIVAKTNDTTPVENNKIKKEAHKLTNKRK